jgi:hypothetical protein
MKKLATGKPMWWVGKKVTCVRCGSEYELERRDFRSPWWVDRRNGDYEYLEVVVVCPDCGIPNTVRREENEPVVQEPKQDPAPPKVAMGAGTEGPA